MVVTLFKGIHLYTQLTISLHVQDEFHMPDNICILKGVFPI